MFDIGWTEMFVVAIVAILFVGPKELPGMLRTAGQMLRKVRGMVGDAKQQFNEAVRDAELDGVQDGINQVRNLDPTKQIKDKLNPLKEALNDPVETTSMDSANAEAEAAERKRRFEEIAEAAQSSGTSAIPGLGTAKATDTAAKPKAAGKSKTAAKPKAASKAKTTAKSAAKPKVASKPKAVPKATAKKKAAAKPKAKPTAKSNGAKA